MLTVVNANPRPPDHSTGIINCRALARMPRETEMLDTDLRQSVVDELEFEPSLDAANIGVAVDEGVVTLTGHVETYAEKMTAERITSHVKGVKGIAQEIEVRPVGTHLTADDEIAKRIVNVLRWNTSVPQDAIKIKVTKGWVQLSGTVEWHFQRDAAARALQGMAGVTGVTNAILISPKANASDVRERIEKALKRDAEVEAAAIKISVVDGTVTLDGKVHSLSERRAAERAAWAAPGVRNVTDHLSITG
jgi:osmotically-inducible protein OsmY